ncbi:hypothetical protein N656DRAFT_356102 [Canariomyces notabilis]|uniref:Uncharacterized protein n=1 Tax=Canariomyces notabilis TaxID=2074819 RepID=A0AAN6T8G1_9PEZI|nr:hypothetical protein N656DRAFT_356102 [Canariomyces arenarius]
MISQLLVLFPAFGNMQGGLESEPQITHHSQTGTRRAAKRERKAEEPSTAVSQNDWRTSFSAVPPFCCHTSTPLTRSAANNFFCRQTRRMIMVGQRKGRALIPPEKGLHGCLAISSPTAQGRAVFRL